jgi:hypothetical protein
MVPSPPYWEPGVIVSGKMAAASPATGSECQTPPVREMRNDRAERSRSALPTLANLTKRPFFRDGPEIA